MKKKNSRNGFCILPLMLSLILIVSFIGISKPVSIARAEVKFDGQISEKEYAQSKTYDKGNFELDRKSVV